MRTVVDFESYYDKHVSITTLGLDNYIAWADAYIVSIVSDDLEFCGTIDQVREHGLDKIALDPDRELYAANANFDQRWWEKYFPHRNVPWKCILDQAAFHQFPRALDGVCRAVLNKKLDKTVRDEMKGVVFETLPEDRQQRVIDYCLEDSRIAMAVLEKMGPMSPVEEELAAHTRLLNRRGIHVNLAKIERDVELLSELHFSTMKSLPWVESGAKPLSYLAFADYCNSQGVPPPASLDKRDQLCAQWCAANPGLAKIVQSMRTYRGSNTKLEKLKAIVANARPDGRIPLDLLYCGARHTRRWSSKNINVQNLDAKRVFAEEMAELPFFRQHPEEEPGIFMREYFIPPPGKKFGILDYSQIEPRCLNWLVENEEMLVAIRAGYGIYEAHAKATMKWNGKAGSLKSENPLLYKIAKERVLSLGYGMGWTAFQSGMKTKLGLDLTDDESKAQVTAFRNSNPKIVAQWRAFDRLIRDAAYGEDRTLEIEMPTGDKLIHFHVRGKGVERGFESFTIKSDFSQMSHQPRLWGGTLTENVIQRMARDVLAEGILRVEKAGIPVAFHAHDELVFILDADNAQDGLKEAEHLMSIVPEWCPGLPLAVDGGIFDHYTKLN